MANKENKEILLQNYDDCNHNHEFESYYESNDKRLQERAKKKITNVYFDFLKLFMQSASFHQEEGLTLSKEEISEIKRNSVKKIKNDTVLFLIVSFIKNDYLLHFDKNIKNKDIIAIHSFENLPVLTLNKEFDIIKYIEENIHNDYNTTSCLKRIFVISNNLNEQYRPVTGIMNTSNEDIIIDELSYPPLVLKSGEVIIYSQVKNPVNSKRYHIFDSNVFKVNLKLRSPSERLMYHIKEKSNVIKIDDSITQKDFISFITKRLDIWYFWQYDLYYYEGRQFSKANTVYVSKSKKGNIVLRYHKRNKNNNPYGNFDITWEEVYTPEGKLLSPLSPDPNSNKSKRKQKELENTWSYLPYGTVIELDDNFNNTNGSNIYIQRVRKDDVEFFDIKTLSFGFEYSGFLSQIGESYSGLTQYVYARTPITTITVDCSFPRSHCLLYRGWKIKIERRGHNAETFFVCTKEVNNVQYVYIARAAYLKDKYGSINVLLNYLNNYSGHQEIVLKNGKKIMIQGLGLPYFKYAYEFFSQKEVEEIMSIKQNNRKKYDKKE